MGELSLVVYAHMSQEVNILTQKFFIIEPTQRG